MNRLDAKQHLFLDHCRKFLCDRGLQFVQKECLVLPSDAFPPLKIVDKSTVLSTVSFLACSGGFKFHPLLQNAVRNQLNSF